MWLNQTEWHGLDIQSLYDREQKFNWIIIFIIVINIFADSVIGIFAVEPAH
jgi:hypothetical protein